MSAPRHDPAPKRVPKAPPARTSSAAGQPADRARLRTVTIGTAGHVDHGKSALVRVLTGIDPDRLEEEQARGMTIVLGFAPLQLPSGRLLNIVDVPGHDQLVRTMASGVCGMEAVLLCIDCRERVMPQTREHLDILRLLGIQRGIVVLTKADLIEDPDERLVAEDAVHTDLRGTVLQDAPVVWTSSRSREGLGVLLEMLETVVAELPPRDSTEPVRMPVDRAFSIKGFGTVVTGTLLAGTIRPNQLLMLLPQGTDVRVRGIQIQHGQVPEAKAGERPAVNLADVDAADIPGGSTLVDPRAFDTTTRVLAEVTLLPRARAIERRTELELLNGTALTHGRARIHAPGRTLRPGGTAVVQLSCHGPLVLVHGDLVLVRDVATNTTIGRARVLDPHPPAEIDLGAATAVRQAPTVSAATAEIVKAGGSLGVPERELAHKIALVPATLPVLVHTSKTYWSQDTIAQAREALIKAMPAPGTRAALADWWSVSPIQDRKILERLTTQIAYWFQLDRARDAIVCPRRTQKLRPQRKALADTIEARPRRPARLTPLLPARTEAVLRRSGVITIAVPPQFAYDTPERTRAAIEALCSSGRLIRLGRRGEYAVHPAALTRLIRQITPPTTEASAARALGVSRAQAHAILGYLLKHGRVAFARGRYLEARPPVPGQQRGRLTRHPQPPDGNDAPPAFRRAERMSDAVAARLPAARARSACASPNEMPPCAKHRSDRASSPWPISSAEPAGALPVPNGLSSGSGCG